MALSLTLHVKRGPVPPGLVHGGVAVSGHGESHASHLHHTKIIPILGFIHKTNVNTR